MAKEKENNKKEVQKKNCTSIEKTKKTVKVYICSNGAEYNTKEDAEEYQKVLDAYKQVKEIDKKNMNLEWVRLVFEVILGGGWVLSLINLRSTKKKSRAEALQAEMELGKSYVEEFTKNIAEPLKEKVYDFEKAAPRA